MHALISKFLRKQHVLHLSVIDNDKTHSEGSVYTASCFYVFDAQNQALVFKSKEDSKHITLAVQSPIVGVSIAYNTPKIPSIKGVQIKARFLDATTEQSKLYYKRFTIARFRVGAVYALEILWLKYTDNSLKQREKLEFTRD